MYYDTENEYLIVGLEKVDKRLLDRFYCRAIGTHTTGLDHIDLKECKKRGIKVISLREYPKFLETITPTAEHTMGLMLSLLRQIPWAHGDVLKGRWHRDSFLGQELKGKRILIIGHGRLGKMVERYSKTFKMKVKIIDKKNKRALLKLLPWANIITLHIHLEGNKGYFDEGCFREITDGSYFINTSRGGIIDENALLLSLKVGRLAGAALDVVQGEPRINPRLLKYARDHTNLLITPHLGGATMESLIKTERFIEQKVRQYLKAE